MRKVWKEIQSGQEWIVDGDLKDFFGSVDHEKLLTLVAQRVADGRVLRLIRAMLKAGSYGKGQLFPTERGTPQGGVVSPLLSNILLTPFDREMRRKGYQLTRYADDWVITCKSAVEARAALAAALRILEKLGVQLNPEKTRIVHVRFRFEFLGYQIKRGRPRQLGNRKLGRTAPGRDAIRVPAREIDPPFPGSGAPAHQPTCSGHYPGVDRRVEPQAAWLGPLLPAGSRPQALHPARCLDRAAHLVAPMQTLAL